ENTMPRLKVLVDGVFFQFARSEITRLWASALPRLVDRHPIDVILLDRGNAPDLPGIERIPFPSYGFRYSAQDSMLLEKMCELRATDIFVSTYYTTPLRTPSLSVVYDMIAERLDCDLNERARREKELAIAY